MKRVLVLGGTGAMGEHLVKELLSLNFEVFVTSRSRRKSTTNLHYIQGSALSNDFLTATLKDKFDVIVDFMSYTTNEFKNRLDLLLSSTKQYVFLSSARVFDNSITPLTESSDRLLDVSTDNDFLKSDDYALAKARQEDLLRNNKKNNWTIIRPYITYGNDRFQLGAMEKESWLYRAVNGRTIVFSKDIANCLTTLTYGLDVSIVMSKLIGKDEALSNDYNITSNISYTWNEVLNIYISAIESSLGRKPKVLITDKDIKLKYNRSTYQIIYDRLFNRTFETTKVSKYLNADNFTSINEGLTTCMRDFLSNPKFKQIHGKDQAIQDRICGEITSLKEFSTLKMKVGYLVYRFII